MAEYESKWEGPGWYRVWEILCDGSLKNYDICEYTHSRHLDVDRFVFRKIELPEEPKQVRCGWYLVRSYLTGTKYIKYLLGNLLYDYEGSGQRLNSWGLNPWGSLLHFELIKKVDLRDLD